MNKFEKISFEQFKTDFNSDNQEVYNDIKLPKRATKGSLGYDFFAPQTIALAPGGQLVINTGIKCSLDEDKGLFIFPRSGLGFKYGIRLANTVGVIDVDYYGNESNEGHIKIKICNGSDQMVKIPKGDAFAQGVIFQRFLTIDDDIEEAAVRTGGFGSTTEGKND